MVIYNLISDNSGKTTSSDVTNLRRRPVYKLTGDLYRPIILPIPNQATKNTNPFICV